MTISVILTDFSNNLADEVIIENPESKRCFSYTDNQKCNCEMCIYDGSLCFFRETEDYLLELNLNENNYAKIVSQEGEIKLDVKVVDFIQNDDILVVRYIVSDEEREIKVLYRS